MQEIWQSINIVTSSPGFFWYVGTIISIGMLAGSKYDNKFTGFIKSLSLILPYTFVLLLTTFSRLYQTYLIKPLSSDAFNGSITLIIITLAYILGLFMGHMAVKKGKEAAEWE